MMVTRLLITYIALCLSQWMSLLPDRSGFLRAWSMEILQKEMIGAERASERKANIYPSNKYINP